MIGLVAIISVNGIKTLQPGTRTKELINILGISDFKFQMQVAILAFIAAILLVSRTLLTMYFTRRMLYYLSRKSAAIASNLISKLLSQDLLTLQKRSSQETLFAVTTGVNTMF
jgi:hypothetical protein